MPDKHKGNRLLWWSSMLAAGPGWIVLGCFKQLAGVLLASIAVLTGLAYAEAKEPVQMYCIAYTYVFDHPSLALFVSTVFVITSQIKINVTNAYAGSLAWSNFFSRVTHAHPGRVVWLVFNIGIALLLMELGVFDALQKVLGLYSNFAIAWIAVVVADLTINKSLKLSPPVIEFKRAHLYDYNPVGVVSMGIAVLSSTLAFTGLFGLYAQAYSWLIALVAAFVLTPLIAIVTKGKYYIARQNVHFESSDQLCTCGVCDQQYAQTDFAYCTFHEAPICSLCCTLDSSCKDQCKPKHTSLYQQAALHVLGTIFKHKISTQVSVRIARFARVSGGILGIVGLTFWLTYSITNDPLTPQFVAALNANLFKLFCVLAVLICILAWWIVLGHESQALAETELEEQNERLEVEITERRQAETALVDQICQILRRSAINPNRLKLELTETLVLDNIDDTIIKMNALQKIGVRFSMDDFGTGYSSLAYLTQLPFNQLKIDQSFVRNIGMKPTDSMIVQTIIGMAKNLAMQVIAEGVETEAQRAFLEQYDCPLFQGFLISRPVPIEQFEQLLKRR